jgi:SPP1 family predicted phage head-tail adaptor
MTSRHERVRLESAVRVADEIGGAAIAWADQGEVWATIDAASTAQLERFDTHPATTAFRVSINRREDVRAGWRVMWGARELRIVGVSDSGAPRMVLICEEEKL